jgi:hypothetical protein
MIAGYATRLGTRVGLVPTAAVVDLHAVKLPVCALLEYFEILQLESGFETKTRY